MPIPFESGNLYFLNKQIEAMFEKLYLVHLGKKDCAYKSYVIAA